MQYCHVDFICIAEGEAQRDPVLVRGLLIGSEGAAPSCYREILRTSFPFKEPRAWSKISGDGRFELPYILQDAKGEIADARLVSGDYAYEWITKLADFDTWWDNLVKPTFSLAETVAVAMVNFHAAKGAIGVLGRTAPAANMWITRTIQAMGNPIDDMFDAAGKPLPGLNGAAGKVLQNARVISNWARRLRVLAYIAVFADGVIYGMETGDWTMSIYRIAAGSVIVGVVTTLGRAIASGAVSLTVLAATAAVFSSGWIAAGSVVSLLGPLAVVAVTAIAVGCFLYWAENRFDLTGKLAKGMKIIGDAITEGVSQFVKVAQEGVGRLGDAIDEGIEAAVKTGQALWNSLSEAADDVAKTIQETSDAVSKGWEQNVAKPAARKLWEIEGEILWRLSPDLYRLMRQ